MAATRTSGKDRKAKKRAKDEQSIKDMRANFQANLEGVPDSGSGKKRYVKPLILLAALLLIGAGGGGAWFFFFQPQDEEPAVTEVKVENFPKVYISVEPVHIAFVQDDGRRQRLVVNLTLEVVQRDDNVAQVQHAMPKLQEAYWRSLNAAPLKGADIGAIELADVKERIRRESEKLLGGSFVSDVLIVDARMIRG